MKMFLNPMCVRPKGKPKDVFENIMNKPEDKSDKKKKSNKKNKPWRGKKEK